ncbi:MAG TPA: hypothetical protein VH136_03565 [Trebonia sp.]|nr:hypothetical protein [Trebonia sp.]
MQIAVDEHGPRVRGSQGEHGVGPVAPLRDEAALLRPDAGAEPLA